MPSDVIVPGLLDGLPNVCRLVARSFSQPLRGPSPVEVTAIDDAPPESPVEPPSGTSPATDGNSGAARLRS